MQTLEAALAELTNKGVVTMEDALAKTSRQEEFKRLLKEFKER